MSFDLKIKNGDVFIGSNGDLQQVTNTEKLIQDIVKMIITPLGSNVFQPGYGSQITRSLSGNAYDMNFVSSNAENQIRNSLESLMRLQMAQALRQTITPSEQIAAISNISVTRNQNDPRYFLINIKVIAKDLSVVSTQFTINTSI